MKYFLKLCVILVLFAWVTASGQSAPPDTDGTEGTVRYPAAVTDLKAFDTDNDHGHSVTLTWELSADDGAGANSVLAYEVFRWFPRQMDVVDSLRHKVSNTRSTVRAFRLDIPRARSALRELRDDPGKLESLRFRVAAPEDDNMFVLTAEYAIRALEDTITAMEEQLPLLKGRIRPLQKEFGEAVERLPEAHGQYPQDGVWRSVGKAASGNAEYINSGAKEEAASDFIPDHTDLYYSVDAVTVDSTVRASSNVVGPVQCSGQWFNTGLTAVFVFVVVFWFLTVMFVSVAKKGADLYVRPLAGIEAVDDAIGRATEMGRPILYVLGLGTAEMVATIASFTILGRVAKRVAEYQTQLIVPCYDAIVMAVAQEVVKSAYFDAGRPDDYDEDSVHFVTNMQFAYVAAVNGIMLRELPATNVYMGKFFAESLILAETGALAGSIQIAGTDEIAQIPFFIVACDYTLIGEELYAASAYLGREPILLGSLKAQDWAKAIVIGLVTIGLTFTALGWNWFAEAFRVVN